LNLEPLCGWQLETLLYSLGGGLIFLIKFILESNYLTMLKF
jgi:hypothetical protein